MLANLLLPDGTTTELYYRVWGDENAPRKVMCVHGLTRNSMDFEVLATALANDGFCVIAPDMPGRGQSPSLKNSALYNNAVNASLCLQLLAKRGIAHVEWLGTSMGGMIAMLVANQAPGFITKLILNDVGCVVTASSIARINEYVGQSPVFSTYAEAETQLKIRTQFFAIPAEYWQAFAKNSIAAVEGGYRLAYDPRIADVFKAFEPGKDIELWPLWEAVKTIPTLLIRGEHSDLLSEETAKTMQATHPRLTRLNIAGAGHAPALMTRYEIDAVRDFII